jgi:nitronate monooxygenase/enoyl-[acyl-carrier protein] reductase II
MRTPLCDLLGIEVPVIAAPFGPWDSVDLAAAVCGAGGLGSLGTAVRPLPDLQEQWRRLRQRTDRPFAINHQVRPFDEQAFAATLAARPAAISFHMADPGDLVGRAHDAGIRWIQQVMDVDQAEVAVRRGADVVIAQGGEAGGHSGSIGTLSLVPQVVDVAGDVPVVAAGGVADGRGLAAALALGAQGVVLGTRLLASTEMAVSAEWKRMLVEAASRDSVHEELLDVLLPPFNRPHWPAAARVLRTRFAAEWAGRGDELAARAGELAPVVVREVLAGGGQEHVPFAGQSVGLVRDIRPAADIVRDAVAEADRVLAALGRRTSGSPAVAA